jgi:hypothetical protein
LRPREHPAHMLRRPSEFCSWMKCPFRAMISHRQQRSASCCRRHRCRGRMARKDSNRRDSTGGDAGASKPIFVYWPRRHRLLPVAQLSERFATRSTIRQCSPYSALLVCAAFPFELCGSLRALPSKAFVCNHRRLLRADNERPRNHVMQRLLALSESCHDVADP